ncbi:hypothetical protein BCT62_24905 [Vibrio splendidus]|uniref:hypothetical protein n=1 Tax=Vibrio splendidus TaxID=29497 RepID=UPI000C863477|nr:hypothetical protein [Vibrio splendidus]PMM16012.1 hypothetical protein BCT62_24905 [Vibrio splendidus]
MAKQPKLMSPQEIHEIFKAQTENVRELDKAWKHINRIINEAYRSDNHTLASFQTRMLGLVFSAYAEATFSKLIHTPCCFTGEQVNQIKNEGRKDIISAWKKCIELGTDKITSNKSNHVPNIKKKILELLDLYIKEPSLVRNKVAHGQWKVSLNRDNNAVNQDMTTKIASLSVVDLYRYKAAFDSLSGIVEDIIESPNKAHWRFYWEHVTQFEQTQKEMATWTVEDKIESLKRKAGYHKVV